MKHLSRSFAATAIALAPVTMAAVSLAPVTPVYAQTQNAGNADLKDKAYAASGQQIKDGLIKTAIGMAGIIGGPAITTFTGPIGVLATYSGGMATAYGVGEVAIGLGALGIAMQGDYRGALNSLGQGKDAISVGSYATTMLGTFTLITGSMLLERSEQTINYMKKAGALETSAFAIRDIKESLSSLWKGASALEIMIAGPKLGLAVNDIAESVDIYLHDFYREAAIEAEEDASNGEDSKYHGKLGVDTNIAKSILEDEERQRADNNGQNNQSGNGAAQNDDENDKKKPDDPSEEPKNEDDDQQTTSTEPPPEGTGMVTPEPGGPVCDSGNCPTEQNPLDAPDDVAPDVTVPEKGDADCEGGVCPAQTIGDDAKNIPVQLPGQPEVVDCGDGDCGDQNPLGAPEPGKPALPEQPQVVDPAHPEVEWAARLIPPPLDLVIKVFQIEQAQKLRTQPSFTLEN